MSRPSLPPPPSVDELGELARLLAVEAPALLPAFVWCLCRSSRAVAAYRTADRPQGVHLAMLHSYPTGARLISSSDDGAKWLHTWTETSAALDELLPIAPGDPGHDDAAESEQGDAEDDATGG